MEVFLSRREIMFSEGILDISELRSRGTSSSSDTDADSSRKFKLIVPSSKRPVYCTRKVIDSSSLLVDMLEYVNDEEPGYEFSSNLE